MMYIGIGNYKRIKKKIKCDVEIEQRDKSVASFP